MKRSELYDHIKGLGLQKEIESRTGKHYTNCPNLILEGIVLEIIHSIKPSTPKDNTVCECNSKCNGKQIDIKTKQILRLLEVLHKKKILLDSELQFIMNEN